MTDTSARNRSRTVSESEFNDGSASAVASIERALLGLGNLPAGRLRTALLDDLVAVRAALLDARDRPVGDPTQLSLLDAALQGVPRARLALDAISLEGDASAEALGRSSERLTALARGLAMLRERTIDAAVRHQLVSEVRAAASAAVDARLGDRERTFRASNGVPAVHHIGGAAVASPGPVSRSVFIAWSADDSAADGGADDSPWEPDSDELDEPRRRPVTTSRGRERQSVELSARSCLIEIASLCLLRRPRPDQPWSHARGVERRLLDAFDALGALARSAPDRRVDLVKLIVDYTMEAPVPDRGRAFARGFVLGSFAGAEPVANAVLATRQAPIETRSAEWQGYALASSALVGTTLRPLLADDDASLVRLATCALSLRGELETADAVPLLGHPDPEVAIAAARGLGVAARARGTARFGNPERRDEDRERNIAAHDLPAALSALAELLTGREDDALALAAACALRRLGDERGLAFVRNRLRDEAEATGVLTEPMRIAYALTLAMAGESFDTDALLASVRGVSVAVTALGWHGSPKLVEPLIDMLRTANKFREQTGPFPWRFELAAAEALHRITGAPLRRDRASVDDSADLQLLTDATGFPELAAEAEQTAELLALAGSLELDADAWATWWKHHRSDLSIHPRLRRGAPYGVASSIDELAQPDSLPSVRRNAELELAFARPGAHVEIEGWVDHQLSELRRLAR